jgi:hypothetical protein
MLFETDNEDENEYFVYDSFEDAQETLGGILLEEAIA